MEIEPKLVQEALRKILEVEHAHIYGAKTGSDTARRKEIDTALGRVLNELMQVIPSKQ